MCWVYSQITLNSLDLIWKTVCWITPWSAVDHLYGQWGRYYVCGRTIIWAWLDIEPLRNSQLHSPHGPSRTHWEKQTVRWAELSPGSGEGSATWKSPSACLDAGISSPASCSLWYSHSSSAVGSDYPQPERWRPTSNKGMQASSMSLRQVRWAHYTMRFHKPSPSLTSCTFPPHLNSAPVALSHKHASESPGGLLTSQKMMVPVCHWCPPCLSTLPLLIELVSLAAMLWINLTPYSDLGSRFSALTWHLSLCPSTSLSLPSVPSCKGLCFPSSDSITVGQNSEAFPAQTKEIQFVLSGARKLDSLYTLLAIKASGAIRRKQKFPQWFLWMV